MIVSARKVIDDVLCMKADECFEQSEWLAIMEADGAHFEDGERVEWVMEAVRRGISEKNAASLYQVRASAATTAFLKTYAMNIDIGIFNPSATPSH